MASNQSSSGSSDEHASQPSGQTTSSAKRVRKPRTQSKWPTDMITVTEIDEDGLPTDKVVLRRFRKVAGLNAREKVPITLPQFDDLTEAEKNTLFDDGIMKFLEFPDSMKKQGFKAAMKAIAKLWRHFKSTLVNKYMAVGLEPFGRYKHLKKEDWEAFVELKSSEEFKKKSEEKKELRARSKHPHRLGTGGYVGKKGKWQAEDRKYEEENRENPWMQFPGRSQPFLRARGSVSESGDITFSNVDTEQVAQKVKEITAGADEGSFTGIREHDALSTALGNPEHAGRVRGISSSQGWKIGFSEHREMYKKRKRTPVVDVEELTATVRQQVLEEVMERLASQGVQLSGTPRNDSPVPRKSSCGSKEVEQPWVAVSDEPDTIDRLDKETPCSLVIKPGGYQIEVAIGKVHPNQNVLHTVPVVHGYAVVTVDMVHANFVNHALDFPVNDEVTKLGEALLQRVQWRRSCIVVADQYLCQDQAEPAASAPHSHMSPRDIPPPSPPRPMFTPPSSPRPKIAPVKQVKKKVTKKQEKKPVNPSANKEIAPAYTKDNPKYKYGKSLLTADEVRRAGQSCIELHNYYLQCCRDKKATSIVVKYQNRHFLNDDGYFLVGFNDLYDLFNLDALDVGLLRCFTL